MSPWVQAGIGITTGFAIWKYFLEARVEAQHAALVELYPEAYEENRSSWKKKTVSRESERERMYRRAPSCFLKAGMKYPVCASGGSEPTCEGLLSARRRAILNKDLKVRKSAEHKALALGCGWAHRSKKLVI